MKPSKGHVINNNLGGVKCTRVIIIWVKSGIQKGEFKFKFAAPMFSLYMYTLVIIMMLGSCHAFSLAQTCQRITRSPTLAWFVTHNASSSFHPSQSHSALHSTSLFATPATPPTTPARVVFLGTPGVAASTLKQLYESSILNPSLFELVCIVTQPPKPSGRNNVVKKSPVHDLADSLSIPTLTPNKASSPDFLESLSHLNPDICITAAYGQYLPKRFLSTPKFGTLNIHPSLLPLYRGASPVQRSIQQDDDVLGVSLLFTVTPMDAGPIVAASTLDNDKTSTSLDLLDTLFTTGTKLLVDKLPMILSGEISQATGRGVVLQDEAEATGADKISKEEGELNFETMTAVECHNNVRAFFGWPGSSMELKIDDEVVKVKVHNAMIKVEVNMIEVKVNMIGVLFYLLIVIANLIAVSKSMFPRRLSCLSKS